MPLTRYQIRNEYSLADPELYRAADKDDPEAVLEGVAMAGLVGVLRQLGDLAEFAAEIFHDLHEEVMATAARGHGLMIRVQQLEAEFPSIEKAFLSQTSHSSFFYSTGVDWHPNLRMDQNLITQGDLPRFVMDSYEECRGPPRLFLLDKFDVAGAGACLKRYTDPSFFKVESLSSKISNAEVQREKKSRKAKKKGSRWRNRETPEVLPTSHAKLHQLFLEESVENHINDPACRVKLKRRLNGFPFDSKTGRSYMEKYLKTPTTGYIVDGEISDNSSPLRLSSNITGESGIEIIEIRTVSPDQNLPQRKGSPSSSPDVEEIGQGHSINELSEVNYGASEVPMLDSISEGDNLQSAIHEEVQEKEIAVDGESKLEDSVDGYSSDDIASEVDNYLDALTTMDSEMETDTECRAKHDLHFLNIKNQGMDFDVNEEQHDLQTRYSDSQSIRNSNATEDENSSSRKGKSSFACSDSLSNSAEIAPYDGGISAAILPSTEICDADADAEIVNMSSDRQSANGENQSTQSLEHMVGNGVCIKGADTPRYRSEFAEPSSSSCLTDSTPILLPGNGGEILLEGDSAEPELDEVSSDRNEYGTPCINPEENMTYMGGNLPWISKHSDSPSQKRDDFLLELSFENHAVADLDDEDPDVLAHASLHHSNILELTPAERSCENFSDDELPKEHAETNFPRISVDGEIDSPHIVPLHTEDQHLDSVLPRLEICNPSRDPDSLFCEVDDASQTANSSSSVVASLEASDYRQQQFVELSENATLLRLDAVEVNSSYYRENLDGVSNAPDGGVDGFSTDMDFVGKYDANLKSSSDLQNPDSPSHLGVHLDDVVTENVHSEVAIEATVCRIRCDDNGDNSLYAGPTGLLEESVSVLQDLRHNGLDINEASLPEHLEETITVKDVDQQVVTSDADSALSNTVFCDESNSEVLNSVSSDQNGGVSESTSAQQINVTENAEDAVSSLTDYTEGLESPFEQKVKLRDNQFDTAFLHDQHPKLKSVKQISVTDNAEDALPSPIHHVEELRSPLEQTVELQGNQVDLVSWHVKDAESESVGQIYVTQIAEDAVTSRSHHIPELQSPSEQKVELQENQLDATELLDNHYDVVSWHVKDSESKSGEQIYGTEIAEDAVTSHTHQIPELHFASEEKVELQEKQLDVESQHADMASSEPSSLVEQMQSLDHLDEERCTDTSSEFGPPNLQSQTLVSELLPHFQVMEQAKHSSSSFLPSFGLRPEVSQINLDEMPPLPPLPPMQWRIGKGQQASLASERDLVGHDLDSFQPILSSRADEGELAQRPQPSNPFLSFSATKDENPQHGHDNLSGFMVHSNSFLLLAPTLVNHNNSKDGFPTSCEIQSTNPITLPATIFDERSEQVHHASEGGTAQASVVSHSPVTSVEVTVSPYPSSPLPEKLVQPRYQIAPETSSESEKFQEMSDISEEKGMDRPDTTPSLTTLDDQPQHDLYTSGGQTSWSLSTTYPLPPCEDGKLNGNRQIKLPRPRNPLIDAVAAHDKSKLRKVTERARPQIEQKVEERDSLLEQIRTKSFNLKPAVMTRPSVQGPKTNLKVAAILEKANAIRQALAGSDEDDDEDNWSDS